MAGRRCAPRRPPPAPTPAPILQRTTLLISRNSSKMLTESSAHSLIARTANKFLIASPRYKRCESRRDSRGLIKYVKGCFVVRQRRPPVCSAPARPAAPPALRPLPLYRLQPLGGHGRKCALTRGNKIRKALTCGSYVAGSYAARVRPMDNIIPARSAAGGGPGAGGRGDRAASPLA
ncbi:hypothetical protein EVAR_48434_1 [Eumeta japonica]|uniref:Uncharacterized protein n=1 Tax=Eumeta variegata TaxID=151549 RepID=A0A4C1XPI4_EUMVA|nr:hypothetical protein EVAR_48434_1 [Eumeta japonica]